MRFLLAVLLLVATVDFGKAQEPAAPPSTQDERSVELSASLISTYEAVHLAALAAAGQKGDDLRPAATEYRPLLDAFHESVSKLKNLPSEGAASADRILSLLDGLGGVVKKSGKRSSE